MRLVALCCIAGCGVDMTADQPWIPIANIAAPLVPELQAMPPPTTVRSTKATGAIRLVTYNVQYGPDIPAVASAILGDPDLTAADVILVQEIESYPDEVSSRAATLAQLLGLAYVYVPARVRDSGTHGLAILSVYPIENVEKMDLPESPNKAQHRIAISADIDVGGTPIHVIDVHLDTFLSARQRIAQLHPVVIDAPAATIVAGDFNTSWVEWAQAVPVLSSASGNDQAPIIDSYMRALAFATPTTSSGPTEHMFGLEQRLDSVYPRELDAQFGGVVRVGPSDHWPVWVDITLP